MENLDSQVGLFSWWVTVDYNLLILSFFTDIKGGGKEETESPVETMNREFLEEIGTSMNFTIKDDYCFSYMEVLNPNDIRLMSIFCRVTSNLVEFNALLASFHSGNIIHCER